MNRLRIKKAKGSKMTKTEMDINLFKRRLKRHKDDLRLLKRDYQLVVSEISRESIGTRMASIKRRIEHLEFRLWKLAS